MLSILCSWSYQTRGFHLFITSWHIFPVHHFTLAPFFTFSIICLSYINKSFVMKRSCLLPRAKLLRVTFFVKRSYLLPRENFKLPYLPNQAHCDPGICTQLRTSRIHSIHQKSSRGRAGKKVTAVTFFRCPTVKMAAILPRGRWVKAKMLASTTVAISAVCLTSGICRLVFPLLIDSELPPTDRLCLLWKHNVNRDRVIKSCTVSSNVALSVVNVFFSELIKTKSWDLWALSARGDAGFILLIICARGVFSNGCPCLRSAL